MDFADHRIPRHIAKFSGDLASRKPGLPKLLQLLDAIIGPSHYRHRNFPLLAPPGLSGIAAMQTTP
jgi:hypothetical protein